ncbi:MAG: hypothetical protein AAB390_03885 [Patescibacteria group bacterium]
MIFKPKTYKNETGKLIISLVLAAFIVNAATVAPVNALTGNILLAMKDAAGSMFDSMTHNIAVADSKTDFPVSDEREPIRIRTVVATAYSSDPAQTDDTPCQPAMSKFNLCQNFAKTGVEDTIAANFLPLGTKTRFPEMFGDRIFTVRDRMNTRYNGQSRIDFWMNEKADAVQFGVKRMKMEIF